MASAGKLSVDKTIAPPEYKKPTPSKERKVSLQPSRAIAYYELANS